MEIRIHPISGVASDSRPVLITPPPDKSILHRILLIGSLTQSAIRIPISGIYSISHDVIATVLALESLGVPVEIFDDHIELHGVGRKGYRAPTHVINCANSGTTARLLMGVLAGQSFGSALSGDVSLSARPMRRVATLLEALGANVITGPEGTLPIMINGRRLHGASLSLPVASAQMKSAVLLAGLFAEGITAVREPSQSRDHTERMLASFGYDIEIDDEIRLNPVTNPSIVDEIVYEVPGDASSAAFLVVAAILLRRRITLLGVGLNPTRTRFLDVLAVMGVEMEAQNVLDSFGEPRGDLTVFADQIEGALLPLELSDEDIPLLIDELPILFILAMFSEGVSEIRGAGELRKKESDRIAVSVEQLRRFGVEVMEYEDGLSIVGILERRLQPCTIIHDGDHRLAMAFSIAALFCTTEVELDEAEAVCVSYPDFFEHLRALCGRKHVETIEP